MNKKKKIMIVTAVLLAISVGLSACFAPTKTNDETSTPSTSATEIKSTEETTEMTTQQTTVPTTEATEPSQETEPAGANDEETKPVETKPAETEPEETEPPATEPEETEPEETGSGNQGGSNPWNLTYEEYQNMSAAEQRAQMEAFSSIDEFFAWYDAAKKKHEAENPDIEVGGGDVVIPGGN